jgi:hypothetical protein
MKKATKDYFKRLLKWIELAGEKAVNLTLIKASFAPEKESQKNGLPNWPTHFFFSWS